jgi:hypothetical protein
MLVLRFEIGTDIAVGFGNSIASAKLYIVWGEVEAAGPLLSTSGRVKLRAYA